MNRTSHQTTRYADRRTRSTAVAVAVLAAAGGAVVALNADGPATAGTSVGTSASATSAGARTFTVQTHQGPETNIDLGQKGFSAGDQDLFTGTITRQGNHVGRLVGNCTTVRVGKTTADQLCEFVLHLRRGQITAAGTVRSGAKGPGTFSLPVLGGSGRYGTASGQIAITATNGKTVPITVSLR